jgi:cell division protein FtsB
MKEFQRKQKIRKRLYSIPALVILFIILALIVRGTLEVMHKVRVSREHVRVLEEKALALTLRSQELEEGIANLDTEDGVMKELKEKFNVIEEGERVVVVVDEEAQDPSDEAKSQSWMGNIWTSFKDIF